MLRLVGDINLTDGFFDVGFGVGSMLAQGFDPFLHIRRSDKELWVGNFEGVTADVSTKTGTESWQFRVLPKRLDHLQHLDLYGLANNHVMQHGDEAYEQTVNTLEAFGCKVFGIGVKRSVLFEHQGRTVSITGFSQRIDTWSQKPTYWHNPEYTAIEEEMKQLPQEAFKIVYVHWGNEFINYPSSQQKRFAHWLIDAGCDLVIGMHPHILQGYEQYKGKFVFYSIGNFVFNMPWEPTQFGAIVNVDFVNDKPVISYDYIRINKDYSPHLIESNDVPVRYRFESLNKLLLKEENSEEYHTTINTFYHRYRRANHMAILKNMIWHPAVAAGIIKGFIKRRFKYVSSNNE